MRKTTFSLPDSSLDASRGSRARKTRRAPRGLDFLSLARSYLPDGGKRGLCRVLVLICIFLSLFGNSLHNHPYEGLRGCPSCKISRVSFLFNSASAIEADDFCKACRNNSHLCPFCHFLAYNGFFVFFITRYVASRFFIRHSRFEVALLKTQRDRLSYEGRAPPAVEFSL